MFKSHLDERYSGIYHVSSHDGRTVEAVPVDTPEQIARLVLPDTQVVAIDEAQFLDAAIVELVTALANRGRRVILAGTDTDFRGEPFGPMPQLLAVAEMVDKLHAICVICGNPGQPQPASDRRQAGALRLADDHGRQHRVVRGALPRLPFGAAARRRPGTAAVAVLAVPGRGRSAR